MTPPTPDPRVEENPMAWLGEVCACGCPLSEHDNYGEAGIACDCDDHECIPTSKAVYTILHTLRQRLTELTDEREHWESILSDHQLALTEARDELKAAQQTIASLKDVLRTLHDAVVRHGCNETDSWPVTFKAQMDALHTTKDLLEATPFPQTWQPIEAEIEKSLDWINRESFTVDYDTIGRKFGGIGTVVEHSTAMHAILFIRKALREAVASPRGGPAPKD